jgi:hypothetical protein
LTRLRTGESKLLAGNLLHAAERLEPGDLKAQLFLLSNEAGALPREAFYLVPESNHLNRLPHVTQDPEQDEATQQQRREQIEPSDLINPRFQ